MTPMIPTATPTLPTQDTASKPKIAVLFPGQGSQYVGMGRALAEAFPAARAVFDEADAALGFALSDLIFNGPEADLRLTEHTQPAILTVSTAVFRALAPELAARGVEPVFAAGHSLGEYSAHVAAGTFSFADAVRTVRSRGRFMQAAVPAGEGAMAAILGLDVETINDICAQVSDELTAAPPARPSDPTAQVFAAVDAVNDPANPATSLAQAAASVNAVVSPANMNSPDQTVISGAVAAVTLAAARCKEAGAKRTVMLPVSAPFHCALMQPAQDQLAAALEAVGFGDPGFPVAANVDARLLTRGPEVRDALVRQVTAPVRWVECIQRLRQSGATHFLEVGPGKVLAGLNRQILKQETGIAAVSFSIEDPASLEKALAGLTA